MLPLNKETLAAVDHVVFRHMDSSVVLMAKTYAEAHSSVDDDRICIDGKSGDCRGMVGDDNGLFIIAILEAATGHKFIINRKTASLVLWVREDYGL